MKPKIIKRKHNYKNQMKIYVLFYNLGEKITTFFCKKMYYKFFKFGEFFFEKFISQKLIFSKLVQLAYTKINT